MNNLTNQTSDIQAIKEENTTLVGKIEILEADSEHFLKENEHLSDD